MAILRQVAVGVASVLALGEVLDDVVDARLGDVERLELVVARISVNPPEICPDTSPRP